MPYAGNLLDYALVADSLTYMQRVGQNGKYTAPANVSGSEKLLELLKARGILHRGCWDHNRKPDGAKIRKAMETCGLDPDLKLPALQTIILMEKK